MGDSANVIVGPATLRVAPVGSDLPDFEAVDFVWPTGWREVGFTQDGTDMGFSVTVKDIKVDELRSPVQKIIDEEKATMSAKLSEATLDNLYDAIATATLGSPVAATASVVGYTKLSVGGGGLRYVMAALEGLAPGTGLKRVIIGYKGLAQANLAMAFKRTTETIIPIEIGLIADTARPDGDNLYGVWDITAEHTT